MIVSPRTTRLGGEAQLLPQPEGLVVTLATKGLTLTGQASGLRRKVIKIHARLTVLRPVRPVESLSHVAVHLLKYLST